MNHRLIAADTPAVEAQLHVLRSWRAERCAGLSVALVYGGVSTEDRLYIAESPVEQMSVTALARSLKSIGVHFDILDPCEPAFVRSIAGYDVVLSNLHGPYGEDGRLQGLLDYLRKPYCGSGVAASAVAADKLLCKRAMRGLEVPTPGWRVWDGRTWEWAGRPAMVKPSLGGSSVGMSLVHTLDGLRTAVEEAAAVDSGHVLIEDYIPGTPVTVALLELPDGLLVLPPLMTDVPDAEFYDAASKLDADSTGTVRTRPADLTPVALAALEHFAVKLWDGLGCRGLARVDFMVTRIGEPYALEVNTNPGLSSESNFVTAAELCGFDHADVVTAILHEALTRPAYSGPLPEPVFEVASG
ncbi:D-alanine--D-alanine ligase [Actinocorallia herbida]|uniref:D-alanine--D-alanine ligase n=1 Tax=Actinocorallia herbida TaxID=58109 RepID=A0A3N1D3K8_9ACTN|nr:ATP-grasp domain-containing protein [Actinocorallia herbida]ROO88089.1 D-alanine--D-alanine ligase [Actinocorallia herbida]